MTKVLVNMLEVFKASAAKLAGMVADSKEKKGLTNKLSWYAFFIESAGMLADKEGLKRSVAKGGDCFSAKGARSKGVQVFNHLNAGHTITVDGKSYDLAYFDDYNTESLPDIQISVLYSAIKGEKSDATTEQKIELEATRIVEGTHQMSIKAVEKLLGAEAFEAEFNEAKNEARKIIFAERDAKKADTIAELKKAILNLSTEEQTEIAEYTIALVAAAGKVEEQEAVAA